MAPIVNLHCVCDYCLFKDAVVVIGVFDGVHKGHRFIIGEGAKDAKKNKKRLVVATFSVDPDELFHAKRLHKLQSNFDRFDALSKLDGVDAVGVLNFTREFASLSPVNFLKVVFENDDNFPFSVHVGADFEFGTKCAGNVDTLREWGRAHNVQIYPHELMCVDGAPVTATRIRRALEAGDFDLARHLE